MKRLAILALALTACSAPAGSPDAAGARAFPETAVTLSGYESAVSSAMTGTATWCAPTPEHCQSWAPPAMLGAMQAYRWGDQPYAVDVCSEDRCTAVLVVSHCACPATLIDLSPAAFMELAPLERGRIPVTVTFAAAPTPPQTDTEGANHDR